MKPSIWVETISAQQEPHNKSSINCTLYMNISAAHLQITGEERGSFSFRQPGDLLEGEKVVHVDVVLCRRNTLSERFMSWLTKGLQMTKGI